MLDKKELISYQNDVYSILKWWINASVYVHINGEDELVAVIKKKGVKIIYKKPNISNYIVASERDVTTVAREAYNSFSEQVKTEFFYV